METEDLLKHIKKYVDDLELDFEPIITPIMYNPLKLQFDVSFIIMKKVKGGVIPKFKIIVKDLEEMNKSNE